MLFFIIILKRNSITGLFIQTLDSLQYKFSASENSEVAGWTGDFGN